MGRVPGKTSILVVVTMKMPFIIHDIIPNSLRFLCVGWKYTSTGVYSASITVDIIITRFLSSETDSGQVTKFKECSHEKGHTLTMYIVATLQHCMMTVGIIVFAEDEKRDRKGSEEVTQTHTQRITNPAVKPLVAEPVHVGVREEGEMANTKKTEGVVSGHKASSKDEGNTDVAAARSTAPPLPQEELRMRRLKHLEQ